MKPRIQPKTNTRLILTDCDEVLFDWAGSFSEWLKVAHPEITVPDQPLSEVWNIEVWLGIELETTRQLIREFNTIPEYWENFAPLPGVVENVHRLHRAGFSFVAITACDVDQQTWEGRWKNLNDVFGFGVFTALHCVGLAQSKEPILELYRSTYWVEDKSKHAISGANLGHTSFLINYKHNEDMEDPRVTRVNDWNDIADIILN